MSHLDPELLALLALGEPVASDDERTHLAACPACTADLAEMSHAVVVARSTIDDAELESPPSRVWNAIASDLSLSDAASADPFAAAPAPEPDPDPVAIDARERPRRERRRRSLRGAWMLAAAIAVVVAVGAGTWIGIAALGPTPVATAALDAFPDHAGAVGSAEVEESRDGARTLVVTLEGAKESGDYLEVWLIRNDGGALISLGVLDGAKGAFAIPPGVDLSEYDLVDISFEPIDGDPAHSGDSIVRGQLTLG